MRTATTKGLLLAALLVVAPLIAFGISDPVRSTHGDDAAVRSEHRAAGPLDDTDRLLRLNAPRGSATHVTVTLGSFEPLVGAPALAIRLYDQAGRLAEEDLLRWLPRSPPLIGVDVNDQQAGAGPSWQAVGARALGAMEEAPHNHTVRWDLDPGVHWLVVGTEDLRLHHDVTVTSDRYGARVDAVGDAPTMFRRLTSTPAGGFDVARDAHATAVGHLAASASVTLRHGHNEVRFVAQPTEPGRHVLRVATDGGTCAAEAVNVAPGQTPTLVWTRWTPPGTHRLDAELSGAGDAPDVRPPWVEAVVWDVGLSRPWDALPSCAPAPERQPHAHGAPALNSRDPSVWTAT